VINHLDRRFACVDDVGVACIYFDYKRNFQPVDILRSILKGVVQSKGGISERMLELHQRHYLREIPPPLSEVSEALQRELLDFRKFFIVLDALDECTTDKEAVLQELKKLQPNTCLLITGRPFAREYVSVLDGLETLDIRAADSDVEKYVQGQLGKHKALRKYASEGDDLGRRIVTSIVEKAKGM